jgi:lysophospholipase II
MIPKASAYTSIHKSMIIAERNPIANRRFRLRRRIPILLYNVSTATTKTPTTNCNCVSFILFVVVIITMNRAATSAMSTTTTTTTSASLKHSHSKKGALIFLHGLGDTPAGWSSLEQTLPTLRPTLKDIVYVFPPAPIIPISINGGMTMPGWFDLYDWPIAVGAPDDPVGLQRSVAIVENAIQTVHNDWGIPRSKIVVGGFSQGGAVSLLSCYHNNEDSDSSLQKEPLAGCVALSGWLTMPERWNATIGVAQRTPLFWGHGRMDDKVLFEQQAFGVTKLKSQGIQVSDTAYNMGHSSHPQEMDDMSEFVERCLFSTIRDDDDVAVAGGATSTEL